MYKFREIRDENELENFMYFRYENFVDSSNGDFIKKNENRLDIDVYDLHSKHFGLFYKKDPIGSLRIVSEKGKIYDERAYNIGLRNNVFNEEEHSHQSIIKSAHPDFPFANNIEIPNSVKSFYKTIKQQKSMVTEGSRLVLSDKHKGLRVAKFLIESALAYQMVYRGTKHAVLNCNSSHTRFYKQYGFEPVNQEEQYYLKGRTNVSSSVLALSNITTQFKDTFEEMAYQFETKNIITRTI